VPAPNISENENGHLSVSMVYHKVVDSNMDCKGAFYLLASRSSFSWNLVKKVLDNLLV
jgi:hypothetical protein